MNVNKINAVNLSNSKIIQTLPFKAQEKTEDTPATPKRSLTAKKWGVGIVSFFLPGTGQMINGEGGKGAAILISSIILGAIYANVSNAAAKVVLVWSGLGLILYSTINGVSNTKRDKE